MYSFILPNDVHIDTDGVIDAMEDCVSDMRYFLDTSTGDVGCVSSNYNEFITKLRGDQRYIEIPKISSTVQSRWLEDFMKEFLQNGNKKERGLYTRMKKTLKPEIPATFEVCLEMMELRDVSLMSGWATWQGDYLFEEMKKWLKTLSIEIQEGLNMDCDCELCKLLEKGDHTAGDFSEAAEKQTNKMRLMARESPTGHDLYYDAMDAMNDGQSEIALTLLDQALEINPESVEAHHGISAIYREVGNMKKYREHTLRAYELTTVKFKKWPKKLPWGEIDNRQYLRSIFFRAGLYFENNEHEQGFKLFRQLLSMCPNDNLGARYFVAGLYAGKSMNEIGEMWSEANENQKWVEMENMLETQNKKHAFWKMTV